MEKPEVLIAKMLPTQLSQAWAEEIVQRLHYEGYAILPIPLVEGDHEALVRACAALLPEMPTGWEPHGQSMDATIRMSHIREWRQAVANSIKALGRNIDSEKGT